MKLEDLKQLPDGAIVVGGGVWCIRNMKVGLKHGSVSMDTPLNGCSTPMLCVNPWR